MNNKGYLTANLEAILASHDLLELYLHLSTTQPPHFLENQYLEKYADLVKLLAHMDDNDDRVCIYDPHGGLACATFIKKNITQNLPKFENGYMGDKTTEIDNFLEVNQKILVGGDSLGPPGHFRAVAINNRHLCIHEI